MSSVNPSGQGGRHGNWAQIKILGKGGFGAVLLYRNELTGEEIAVKSCRHEEGITKQAKQRWIQEVEIMNKIEHEGIVGTRPLPPELHPREGQLPVLCMEFCNGGDVRKLLSKPENCCGLRERDIRHIVGDVTGGLEFLHRRKVTHRDLKPENVVLCPGQFRTCYKLIDLGYAKDYEQGSICKSFVGTMQYLAPELFTQNPYTNTVDFWSLGTLAFEIITGYRPFLPHLTPPQWHFIVQQDKKDDDICAFFDAAGKLQFSRTIPPPTHLCSVTRDFLQRWLRLVLIWDPHRRGGEEDSSGRQKCFSLLERDLKKQIIHVLDVATLGRHSFPLPDPDATVDGLQQQIETQVKVAVGEQELMLPTGVLLEASQPARICISDDSGGEGDAESLVFLFRRGGGERPARPKVSDTTEPMLHKLLTCPQDVTNVREQKASWQRAVLFCDDQEVKAKRLMLAQRAALLCLLRKHSIFSKLRERLNTALLALHSKREFAEQCVRFDMAKCDELGLMDMFHQTPLESPVHNNSLAQEMEKIAREQREVETTSVSLQTKIVELQRRAQGRSKLDKIIAETLRESKKQYEALRQAYKERDASPHFTPRDAGPPRDNDLMTSQVFKCMETTERLYSEVYDMLSRIEECRGRVDKLMPEVQRLKSSAEGCAARLTADQQLHQARVWRLAEILGGDAQGGQGGQTARPLDSLYSTASSGQESLAVSLVQESLSSTASLRQDSRLIHRRLNELSLTLRDVKDAPLPELEDFED